MKFAELASSNRVTSGGRCWCNQKIRLDRSIWLSGRQGEGKGVGASFEENEEHALHWNETQPWVSAIDLYRKSSGRLLSLVYQPIGGAAAGLTASFSRSMMVSSSSKCLSLISSFFICVSTSSATSDLILRSSTAARCWVGGDIVGRLMPLGPPGGGGEAGAPDGSSP